MVAVIALGLIESSWWLRLIPESIWWICGYHLTSPVSEDNRCGRKFCCSSWFHLILTLSALADMGREQASYFRLKLASCVCPSPWACGYTGTIATKLN